MTAAFALLVARGAAPLADLAFEHSPGRILLRARMNGRPVRVTLDSGASLTVADETAALAAGATRGTPLPVAGNGEVAVAGWRSGGLSLALEGSGIDVPVTVAMALGEVNVGTARPVDAILGCDLLRRYIVEIDYVHTRLRLFAPGNFDPPKGYRSSPLRIEGGRPIVQGSLKVAGVRMDSVSMLVDSGSPGGIDLGSDLVRRSGLAERVVEDADERSAGLGGSSKTRVVFGAKGQVGVMGFSGGVRLELTPGGFGSSYDAKVGDEFLSHGDVILDLPHAKLYVRPNGR